MKTLMIKDLSVSKELDCKAMSAVRGGVDNQGIANNQVNAQVMNLVNQIANGSSFSGATQVQADLNVHQTASNFAINSNEKALGLLFPVPLVIAV